MKYNPDTKIYYGSIDADHRLIPAPDISIKTELQYSNDTVIGINYIIDLNGKATGLDLRNVDPNVEIDLNMNYGIGAVTDHLSKLRKLLVQNGSTLRIVDKNNVEILVAKGGILRSFKVDESDNSWYHFANYTASLEFSSIEFIGSIWKPSYFQENCANPFLDDGTYTKNNDGILDIAKYKIKTFTDSWSITFDENEAFERILTTEISANNLNIDNTSFSISYNISATGKHFWSDDHVVPAWEQAKNFVQKRLHSQVTNLINNVLKNTGTSCNPPDNLNNLHVPGDADGLLKNIGNNDYSIFNEKITCESSESEGSFSATYEAIVKNNSESSWTTAAAKHKISKTIDTERSSGRVIKKISIKGTIEGLVAGGIIRSSQPISLPNQGSFLIYQGHGTNKYTNAKLLLDKIYNATDYNSGIGSSGKKDLKAPFKAILGISSQELMGSSCLDSNPTEDPRTNPPHPISFNLTHDYNQGIITYTVEYSSASCDRRYKEVTIQTSNPTKVLAVLTVPNNFNCPVIQELGTYTAKKVIVNIRGIDLSDTGQPGNIDIFSEITCGSCNVEEYLPLDLPLEDNLILTQKEYTKNPIDGSYSITLGYICGTEGCSI